MRPANWQKQDYVNVYIDSLPCLNLTIIPDTTTTISLSAGDSHSDHSHVTTLIADTQFSHLTSALLDAESLWSPLLEINYKMSLVVIFLFPS